MAPKTKSRTAIWFYAREYIERKKIQNCSINQAIEEVYPEWKLMASFEKAPYERMCEDWRRELKQQKGIYTDASSVKPTSTASVAENTNLLDLQQLLDNMTKMSSKSEAIEKIKNQHWYFIKFQTFCKCEITPESEKSEKYKPFYFVLAEVAILEYSLQSGIINEYHEFIKPNTVPLGYTGQCMDTSKEEHQIPLYNFDQIKKTYAEIYAEIRSFLQAKQENNNCVPVFCMEKDLDSTRFGLNYLHKKSCNSNDYPYKDIYSLENLVVSLAKFRNVSFSTESARDLLTSYAFDYAPNSKCDFHENLGISYCSLGLAKKASYLISDNICQFYGVELTAKHVPIQKPVGTVIYSEATRSKASEASHRSSTTSLYSRSSKTSFENQEHQTRNIRPAGARESLANTRNMMPALDIRRRPLVSDKLEKNAAQLMNDQNNNVKVDESTICSNISTVPQKRETTKNMANETMEIEEDDWVTVESHRNKGSDRTSIVTGSNLSSVENRFMGRGRSLSRRFN